MQLLIGTTPVSIKPRQCIGKGGEADVYTLGEQVALKLFKPPTHPDYAGCPEAREAARLRLEEHQEKLALFPGGLPEAVVAPDELVREKRGGRVVGYTMRLVRDAEVLLRYTERPFRQAGIDPLTVTDIFRQLHGTLARIHDAGVVIGDFNDLNVLVAGHAAHLIDADSFQYGRFSCRLFTARFLDPLLADSASRLLVPVKPYAPASDWYAFAVMLLQCLLYVGPYGGLYRPKDPSRRIPEAARPFERITVFHSEVRYPKPALPLGVLPDDLLHHFHLVFEKDQRGPFPAKLLAGLRWTRCTSCGLEHARPTCPTCTGVASEVARVRGRVTATTLFETRGVILRAKLHQGRPIWLYHDRGAYRREDGSVVLEGGLDSRLSFRLMERATLVGRCGEVLTLGGPAHTRLLVDDYRHNPAFDVSESSRFWIRGGMLQRDGAFGPENLGEVLEGQTRFWCGPRFGFGFYRAGRLSVAFVFDVEGSALNDGVKLPPLPGPTLDAACCLSGELAWFLFATQEAGSTIHRCLVIAANGTVRASAEAERGDGSWLGSLGGKCAAGPWLLAATDDGIVRLEVRGGRIVKSREFPDTEPFVDSECRLLAGAEGLYVVRSHDIRMLRLA